MAGPRWSVAYSPILACLVVAACGSNNSNHPTDGSSPAKDASIADAPSDGPPIASALVINDGTGSITTWAAPTAFVSSTSMGRLFIYNTSSTATLATITTSFGGPDAANFTVDPGNSTCTAPLAAHDGCWIRIKFSAVVAGTKSATLSVSGGGPAQTIALTALGLPTIAGLTSDLAAVDFGTPNKSDTVQRTVLLENLGTTPLTLGTRTATAPFTVSDNCPATLTMGGACTITLTFSSANLGHFTGTLAVASDASNISIPLQATTLRLVTVEKKGDGTGTVSSLPSGITCGSTCGGGFVAGIDVQLTATPDTGMVFGQWDGTCSGANCTIPSPADGPVYSFFANANDKKVNLTFAGTGLGNVVVYSGPIAQECYSDCTIYVSSGTQVLLYGESPSTFAGWTGDCTGTAVCNLGNVVNDRNVTATNNKDMYEATSLFVRQEVRGVALTSTSDLIVGAPHGVSKMTIAGTVAWTTALTDNVEGLVTDTANEIFIVGDASITKLSADGATVWTKPIAAGRQTYANNAAVAVSPDGTVIAILTSTGLRALDASGDDRFSITNASKPTSVAIAPDHTIALGEENSTNAGSPQVAFYSTDGTPVTPYAFSGSLSTAVAFDSNSNLLVVSSGENLFSASRYSGGAESFIKYESINTSLGQFPSGVVSTTSGELVKLRRNQNAVKRGGYKLDLYSTTGTVNYSISKMFDTDLPYPNGIQNAWLASGPANRIVIGGEYGVHTGSKNWLQVLDLP